MSEPGSSALLTLRCPRTVSRKSAREFLRALEANVTNGRAFDVLLTDDAELHRLNLQFLEKDYATDVLSFPSASGDRHLGEIAISVDRAREQGATHGHSADTEIRILMLHGALHLMGMDHEVDGGTMRRAESSWRKRLGLPSALIERARR